MALADGAGRKGQTGAVLAVALLQSLLFAFRFAMAGQLAKLHAPDTGRRGFPSLWGADAGGALTTWRAGHDRLVAFHPATVTTVVRLIVASQFAIVVLAASVAVVLLRGARWRPLLLVALGALILDVTGRSYLELALLTSPNPDGRYASAFTGTGWAFLVLAAVVATGALLSHLDVISTGLDAFTRSPATARIIATACLGFAALLQADGIGAQAEDILRREMDSWPRLVARLVGTIGLFGLAILAASRLERNDPTPPEPRHCAKDLLRFFAPAAIVLAVAGAAWVLVIVTGTTTGTWSGSVLLAALLATIGGGSAGVGRPASSDVPTPNRSMGAKALTVVLVAAFWALLVCALLSAAFTNTATAELAAWSVAVFGLALVARYLVGRVRPVARAPEDHGRRVYAFAAAMVPLGIAMLAARVLAGQIASGEGWWPAGVLMLALVLVAGILAATVAKPRRGASTSKPWQVMVVAVAGLALLISLATVFGPDPTEKLSAVLGSLGVLVAALAVLVALAGSIRVSAGLLGEPLALRALGFSRTPVVSLVAAWMVLVLTVGGHLDGGGGTAHDERAVTAPASFLQSAAFDPPPCNDQVLARVLTTDPSTGASLGPVGSELCAWLMRTAHLRSGPQVLALVTASGGGVRAAAWTERVLDCIFPADAPTGTHVSTDRVCDAPPNGDGPTWSNVFALGGASGGSVGEVSTTMQRLLPLPSTTGSPIDRRTNRKAAQPWIRALAAPDHVAPTFAHMVFGDTLLSPLGIGPRKDRASVLIDRWSMPFEAALDLAQARGRSGGPDRLTGGCDDLIEGVNATFDIGFLAAHRLCPERVPLLLLNGTVVRDGSRFDISPLRFRAQLNKSEADDPIRERRSLDLADVLCPGQDIPIFDAAFLSGRFPLVTPSAHFPARAGTDDDACVGPQLEVVDGGYAENSGTAQIAELWPDLAPRLRNFNAAIKDGRLFGYVSVRPVFLEIDNGADGPAAPCTSKPRESTHNVPSTKRSRSSAAGEPLRVGVTQAQVNQHDGAADESSRCALKRQLAAQQAIGCFTLSMFEHPGRRLPLGWSLTNDVLDDFDTQFRLPENQAMAAALRREVKRTDKDGTLAASTTYPCPGGTS